MSGTLAGRLDTVRREVATAAAAAGRRSADVELLAVSKKHPGSSIRALAELGVEQFGESYVSEAVAKIQALRELPLTWYFLGPIQRNKTRPIAENFDWVLALASDAAARRLSDQRPASLGPLQACIQVNVDADPAKAGIRPDQLGELVEVVDALPNLRIRGLMTIPRARDPHEPDDAPFRALADLFAEQLDRGCRWDTLSMGMSGDFRTAIRAGSTQIRIGTALFGPRDNGPATGRDRTVSAGHPPAGPVSRPGGR